MKRNFPQALAHYNDKDAIKSNRHNFNPSPLFSVLPINCPNWMNWQPKPVITTTAPRL